MKNNQLMHAIVMNGSGNTDVLEYKSIPMPTPGADELLVKVKCTALNRYDILQRQGYYKPSGSPLLGIEIAGDVVAIGNNVTQFKLGDRVFGYVNGGGYAEYCVQDAGFAIPLPETWSYAEGAAVAEVFQTANESVFTRGHLQANETILIHAGASGVGLAAIQMAKATKAKVIVTVGSDEKVKFCQTMGADLAINYKKENFVAAVLNFTHNEGVDLILDSIGAAYLEKNIECLRFDGRLIVIGYVGGNKCEFNFIPFIAKRATMIGHNNRARNIEGQRLVTERFKQRWLPLLLNKEITPNVDKIFSIQEVVQAHEYMEANHNIGKIILELTQ